MAQAPNASSQPLPAPSGEANAERSLSAAGQAAIGQREGQAPGGGYYDDTANNCTYGTGLLAHTGPCTADERRRTVKPQQAQQEMQRRLDEAARRVRQVVQNRRLTQNQFDALVSAIYNTRSPDNRRFLDFANGNDDAAVRQELRGLVNIYRHNAQGHSVGLPRRSQGLVNRRESEIQQYDRPSQ